MAAAQALRSASRRGSSTEDALARVEQSDLIVLPDSLQHLKKSQHVQKMEQFAVSTRNFLQSYDRAMEFIQPYKGTLLKPPVNKPPPVECAEIFKQGKNNLGELGERLFFVSRDVSRAFLLTFDQYQKLCQGSYYQKLDALFELQADLNPGEPVPFSTFMEILPVNEIAKAVSLLQDVSKTWGYMSDVYMNNIHAVQAQKGKVEVETKHLERTRGEKLKAEEYRHRLVNERAEEQGKLAQASQDEKTMLEVVASQGDALQYYVKKREAVTAKREAAEKRLRDYTYKCYGRAVFVWQRDVDLAREEVAKFKQEESELADKIQEVQRSNNNFKLDQCKAKYTKEAQTAKQRIENIEEAMQKVDEQIAGFDSEMKKTIGRIAQAVRKEGAENVEVYMETMGALHACGQGVSDLAEGGETVTIGWIKDLNYISVLISMMARGGESKKHNRPGTLEDQMKALKHLKKFTGNKENVLCQVFIHADPIWSLGSSKATPRLKREDSIYVAISDVEHEELPPRQNLVFHEVAVSPVSEHQVQEAIATQSASVAEACAPLLEQHQQELLAIEDSLGASHNASVEDDMADEH